MSFPAAMTAMFWGGMIFLATLLAGFIATLRLAARRRLLFGAFAALAMNLAILIEGGLYSLYILRSGGMLEDEFWPQLLEGLGLLCPVGLTAGALAFLIGFFDTRYSGKPEA